MHLYEFFFHFGFKFQLGDSESHINEHLSLEVLKEDVTACFTSMGEKNYTNGSKMRDEKFTRGNFSDSRQNVSNFLASVLLHIAFGDNNSSKNSFFYSLL